jgi:hypothetical protein
MFANAMVAAIDAARTLTKLDHLSADIWKAWGSGQSCAADRRRRGARRRAVCALH